MNIATLLSLSSPCARLTQSCTQANEVYPKACIYMQMEASPSEQGDGEVEGEMEGTMDGSPELRLVPSDSAAGKSSKPQRGLHLRAVPVPTLC